MSPSRRRFLAAAATAMFAVLAPAAAPAAAVLRDPAGRRGPGHPDPRPGIDASKVLGAKELSGFPHLVGLFDSIREIPHIVDGIRCYCGCADLDGFRSLLSCYEAPAGMARFCEICEGEGRLAFNRWKEGQSLEQIRRAIDARYGSDAGPADRTMVHAPHDT
ncbi:MAG TPA: hypothetical protein VK912_18870 [Longimicrobiales bacterium]|nr:hypothetical protein [Longimicrobiales bacterium]